jgi:hypothetical protein
MNCPRVAVGKYKYYPPMQKEDLVVRYDASYSKQTAMLCDWRGGKARPPPPPREQGIDIVLKDLIISLCYLFKVTVDCRLPDRIF